jgi:hypothetical protein
LSGVVGTAARTPAVAGAARARPPDDHLFFTHLVFDVGPAELEAVLERQRRIDSDGACPLASPAVELGAGETTTLQRDESVCIEASSADVSLAAQDDGALAHFPAGSARPISEEIARGTSAWYRVVDRSLVLHGRDAPFTLRVERGRARIRTGEARPTVTPGLPCDGGQRAPVDLFVRGEWSGWQAWGFARLGYSDGCYTTVLTLPAGPLRFKVAGADWRSATFGSAGPLRIGAQGTLLRETTQAPTPDAQIRIPTQGRYAVTLRLDEESAALLIAPLSL